jgi:hypothetical protein
MKLSPGLVGVTLGASFAIASPLPLGAAPLAMTQPVTAQNDVIAVQYEQLAPKKPLSPMFNTVPGDLQMRGDIAYLNGHRGYRVKREGYIEHEGWWFPASAFSDHTATGSVKRRHHTSGNM